MLISLVDMEPGEAGIVVKLEGGFGATKKIQSMGIRIGKRVKKLGARFWRGPQTVLVDNFKVAIGFGMAAKISVEVERSEDK
ncbi:MAG: ferrous iron transport protein A [Candidatus Omnitrophota bacterium]|nr:MAG: ferrous iron transport protein A [Candidatus Omnitrophota bacterium]